MLEKVAIPVTFNVEDIVEEACDINPPPMVSLPEVVSSALLRRKTSSTSISNVPAPVVQVRFVSQLSVANTGSAEVEPMSS